MEVVRGSEINKFLKRMNEKILIIAVELLLSFCSFDDDFFWVQKKLPNYFFLCKSRSDISMYMKKWKDPTEGYSLMTFLEYSFFSSLPDRDQKWGTWNVHLAKSAMAKHTERILIERKFFDLLRDIFDSSSSKWKSNHGHDEMTN